MGKTVRETIKDTIFVHLKKNNGLVFGQCLSAVGWVGGTIPELTESDGVIELSMADIANGGIVAGAGLSNRRPIYVIRYQGFSWFNLPIILNYACKSKECSVSNFYKRNSYGRFNRSCRWIISSLSYKPDARY